MTRAQWRDLFGPPFVTLGTATLLIAAAIPASSIGVSTAVAGRGQSPSAPACPPAAAVARASTRHSAAGHGQVRFDPVITGAGELTGEQLDVDTGAGPLAVGLPPESFVGQPVGDLLVYSAYAVTSGSSVHLLDLATGCDVKAASPSEIVRSAVVAPDGLSIYVHSVTRVGRRDNGVRRFDLASGVSTLVVPPLPTSDDFGLTFGTELRWSLGGGALAVQSCGFEACRTRVLNAASGDVKTFDAPGQGALIGLTDQHVVTFAACGGLPCAVLSIELTSGEASVLADAAVSAVLAAGPDGTPTVTIETAAGTTEVVQ